MVLILKLKNIFKILTFLKIIFSNGNIVHMPRELLLFLYMPLNVNKMILQ